MNCSYPCVYKHSIYISQLKYLLRLLLLECTTVQQKGPPKCLSVSIMFLGASNNAMLQRRLHQQGRRFTLKKMNGGSCSGRVVCHQARSWKLGGVPEPNNDTLAPPTPPHKPTLMATRPDLITARMHVIVSPLRSGQLAIKLGLWIPISLLLSWSEVIWFIHNTENYRPRSFQSNCLDNLSHLMWCLSGWNGTLGASDIDWTVTSVMI